MKKDFIDYFYHIFLTVSYVSLGFAYLFLFGLVYDLPFSSTSGFTGSPDEYFALCAFIAFISYLILEALSIIRKNMSGS